MGFRAQILRSAALLAVVSLLHACATTGDALLLLSNADGDHDIYICSVSGVQQITRNDHDDSYASWSPDGRFIVYTANLAGNPEIYKTRIATGRHTRLTNHAGLDAWPQWSPDSSRIVFVSTRTQRESLFIMDADGKNLSELTPQTQSANLPVFSPDGRTIAYLERTSGRDSIALIDPDGQNHRTLIDAPGITGLAWSPDGSSLLYSSRRKKNVDLYLTDIATSDESRLTTDHWIDTEPAWSPDGGRIVWLSARDDHTRRQLYVMNADGSGKRALTTGNAEHMHPRWSPDGQQVAYVAYYNRRFALHLLDLASGESARLSESRLGGTQFQPVFNPRGSHLPLAAIGMQTPAHAQANQADLRSRQANSRAGEGE